MKIGHCGTISSPAKNEPLSAQNALSSGGFVLLTACALVSAAPRACAEDAGSSPSRVLQMLGVGGGASDDGAAAASPPAPATSPAPGATSGPAVASPEGSNSRVLRMLGVVGGGASNEPEAPSSEASSGGVLRMFSFWRRSNGSAAKGLVECPEIVVDGGGADLRAPTGADSSSLRYEIAITRMARECALNGDAISVRVGLQGSAMLGPAGQPGAYYGNVQVALRRKSDAQLFSAKTYRIGAAIPPGAARNEFTLLVEQLEAPFISAKAAEDYEVIVGFTGAGAAPAGGPEKRRRSRSRT